MKESASALRHAMARQMLPEEEHFFFRREMHAGARCGPWLQNLLTRAFFELPSNYGHSVERPAGLLFFVWVLGTVFYAMQDAFSRGEAAAYSFATMFKFFGLQRTYMTEQTKKLADIPWGELVGGTQTVLAFILLFFLGLGLRTRFRLR